MIPYQFLIYMLHRFGTLGEVRRFLDRRFTSAERIAKFQAQLDHMVGNLAAFGFLERAGDGDHVTLSDRIPELLVFRSVDPLYGHFLVKQLVRASFEEKVQALESVLSLPPTIERPLRLPEDLPQGPLQSEVLEPLLVQMGIVLAKVETTEDDDAGDDGMFDDEEANEPRNLPMMLRALFDSQCASPEFVPVQPKWVAGALFEFDCDFYKFIKAKDLLKNEGLVLRHLLRLIILAGEFLQRSGGDPDYERIGELVTRVCRNVDPRYTDRFLASEEEARKISAA